jgi:membrane protease subunit HflC
MVREAAFDRLIAFMEAIASYHLNEGERRKQEILNRTEAEVQRILGEGREQSNRLRGEADAEIIDKYAKAIKETGEFYNFVRTLEAYREALAGQTRLILTTESQILRLLQELPPAEVTSDAAGEAEQEGGNE